MAEANPNPKEEGSSNKNSMSATEQIKERQTEELVISICGFIGSNKTAVIKSLKNILDREFNYKVEEIALSDFINQYKSKVTVAKTEGQYSEAYLNRKNMIDAGNKLREKYNENALLAELAIKKIFSQRARTTDPDGENPKFASTRVCYIINSIKNQEELNLLRSVYRDAHYFIGVFSPIEVRIKNLSDEQIAESEIHLLIDRDSGEDIPSGQTVRNTFTQADFFIRVDTPAMDVLEEKIARFLHMTFGTKVITPSIDETAMYSAYSAAGNSACLSRQVGAALTDEYGEVIALGWNDVPKFGGDLYKNKSILQPNDHRCINMGEGCWNDREKNLIANELVDILIKEKLIDPSKKAEANLKIRKSKIKSLLEFSRAIHAEMHAIIMGSQVAGNRVKNGKLYITTYPCHICARHIVVAGIKEVFYIEPYRKSLTIKLHGDAITENDKEEDMVKIKMFDGVAPRRYLELFKMLGTRKADNGSGAQVDYDSKTAKPKFAVSLEAFPTLEALVVKKIDGELN